MLKYIAIVVISCSAAFAQCGPYGQQIANIGPYPICKTVGNGSVASNNVAGASAGQTITHNLNLITPFVIPVVCFTGTTPVSITGSTFTANTTAVTYISTSNVTCAVSAGLAGAVGPAGPTGPPGPGPGGAVGSVQYQVNGTTLGGLSLTGIPKLTSGVASVAAATDLPLYTALGVNVAPQTQGIKSLANDGSVGVLGQVNSGGGGIAVEGISAATASPAVVGAATAYYGGLFYNITDLGSDLLNAPAIGLVSQSNYSNAMYVQQGSAPGSPGQVLSRNSTYPALYVTRVIGNLNGFDFTAPLETIDDTTAGSGSKLLIKDNGTQQLLVDKAGKMTLGTTPTGGKLDVNGTIHVSASGPAPTSGSGIEVVGGGSPYIQAYNRTGSAYLPLLIDGLSVTLNGGSLGTTTVAGTLTAANATHTSPLKVGTIAGLPGTCVVGEKYFATNATAGSNDYNCTATNVWTQETGGSGVSAATLQSGSVLLVSVASGSSTAYLGTMSPTLTTYTIGQVLTIKWDVTCAPGAVTLNIDSVGNRFYKQSDGSTNPTALDCMAGHEDLIWYDATVFRRIVPSSIGGASTTISLTFPASPGATCGAGVVCALRCSTLTGQTFAGVVDGQYLTIAPAVSANLPNGYNYTAIGDGAGTFKAQFCNLSSGNVTPTSTSFVIATGGSGGGAGGVARYTTSFTGTTVTIAQTTHLQGIHPSVWIFDATGSYAIPVFHCKTAGGATIGCADPTSNGDVVIGPVASNTYGVIVDGGQGGGGGNMILQGNGTNVTGTGTTNTLNIVPGSGTVAFTLSAPSGVNTIQADVNTAMIESIPNAQSGGPIYCAGAGSGTADTCAMATTLTTYTTGQVINYKAAITGSGAAITLAIDSLAAKNIKKSDCTTDPSNTDIVATRMTQLWYNGTVFCRLQ